MLSKLAKITPYRLKTLLRHSGLYVGLQSINKARTAKRLDLCAAHWAHWLHLINRKKVFSISGKTCLEVGAGWVLSHAVVLYLLGARKIIATDITPIARPASLRYAVANSRISLIRDILSPFHPHHEIRNRLDLLLSIKKFSFPQLERLGIEYRAPIDIAQGPLRDKVDFIYSFSVLEHVLNSDVQPLLQNLSDGINTGGCMIHGIHLEDHRSIDKAPFDFLSIPGHSYTPRMESIRGNRIRASQWNSLFTRLPQCSATILYEWHRLDKSIPRAIDSSLPYLDKNDLRQSHLGVLIDKS